MFKSFNKNTSQMFPGPGESSVEKRRMVPHLQESGTLEPDLSGFGLIGDPRRTRLAQTMPAHPDTRSCQFELGSMR